MAILALVGPRARRALAAAAGPASPPEPAFPAVPGLSPEVTPNDLFYTISKNVFTPTVDAKKWRLEVKGHVGRPFSLTYDALRALPMKSQYVTLECISNEIGGDLIGNALWQGVPLRDLLERAGVKPGAVDCVLRAAEGYSDSFPIAKALHPDTLVAVEMNGVPLPPAHGFPARVVVPGIFGMKQVKWLTAIEVTAYDYKGYWQQRGWSDDARMQTHARIDVPKTRASVGGETWVAGIALAGERGIAKVEVSTDGGKTWLPARVKRALSPYSWVLWAYQWKVGGGPAAQRTASLLVKATDGTGAVQTDEVRPTLPDGATGLHGVAVTIKRS
jgi:DMSO/TMAO reductase YedYZ molybdopterin-dependent catalytic subunit